PTTSATASTPTTSATRSWPGPSGRRSGRRWTPRRGERRALSVLAAQALHARGEVRDVGREAALALRRSAAALRLRELGGELRLAGTASDGAAGAALRLDLRELASQPGLATGPVGGLARVLHRVAGAPGEARAALGVHRGDHQPSEHAHVLEEVDLLVGARGRVVLL